jgi:hypothetical protein
MLDWVMIVMATISLGIVIFSIWSMMRDLRWNRINPSRTKCRCSNFL